MMKKNTTNYIYPDHNVMERSRMGINCRIDSTYPNICYCLIDSYKLNSLMWASFNYTNNDNYDTMDSISTTLDRTWRSITYLLDLSYGYHHLSVTSIKQNSGFLICGYEDKTEKFIAF